MERTPEPNFLNMVDTEQVISKIDEALQAKNLQIEAGDQGLKNLRVKAPSIYIVNQALDDADELVLIKLLAKFGDKFKIVSRRDKYPKALSSYFLHLDFNLLQWQDYVKAVFNSLKKAQAEGYSLVLVLGFTDRSIDTPLRDRFLNQLVRAVMRAEMPIVPVRIKAPFPDFVRPAVGGRLIQLGGWREPYKVCVRAGNHISVEDQRKFERGKDFRRFVQAKIFSLGSGLEVRPFFSIKFFQRSPDTQEELIEPIDNQLVADEIGRLGKECLIASQAEFDILVAEATDIPNTLEEIGRLRELTFRAVGEGTGKSKDLDEYDLYYRQLILWDREAKRIAGGYRMGLGDEIFERYGANGFYISSMFKIREGFYPTMQQAVELGRSYIVPDYQKKRLPLFLLWKGILFFLLKNPQFRYLYGPVSISKYYSNLSRGLIVAFIQKYFFNNELAKFLKPRKPFKPPVDKLDFQTLAEHLDEELQTLDNLIEDIEPSHIRIPVLVRQYLKLNARFISFNLDPNFSDVLDGFILLNLQDVPPAMIEALKKEAG